MILRHRKGVSQSVYPPTFVRKRPKAAGYVGALEIFGPAQTPVILALQTEGGEREQAKSKANHNQSRSSALL